MTTKKWLLISLISSVSLLVSLWLVVAVSAQSIQPPATPDIEDLTLVNQIGGSVLAIAKQGNYAYVGMGARLLVLDVQNPTQPMVLGQTEAFSGTVAKIEIAENYAYINAGGDFAIVDISNPAAPEQIGFYDMPGVAYGLTLSGTYAYIAERRVWDGSQFLYGGLRIFDVSTPSTPTEIGYLGTMASDFDVAVRGNYAYLAINSGVPGFAVVNIADPTMPTQAGFEPTPVGPWGITVSGEYLYVAVGSYGVGIYGLDNPTDPSSLSAYITSGQAFDTAVEGNRAYIVETGITVIDITTPALPAFVGSYTTVEGNAVGVSVDGAYAYIAYERAGLRIVDISDDIPVEISSYDVYGSLVDITLGTNYAYVLDGPEGMWILDIANGAAPVDVGFYATYAVDVEVQGNYAYLANSPNHLSIVDVTNPTTPTLVIDHPTGFPQDIAVAGSYAYVLEAPNALQIVDISTPSIPVDVGTFNLPGSTFAQIDVEGNYAYIMETFGNVLYVVDVTIPATPTLVTTYTVSNYIYAFDIAGNYAYIGDSGVGLHVVDVSNPSTPVQVGLSESNWDVGFGDIKAVGADVYIAGGTYGVAKIDVTTPTAPILVDSFNSSGEAMSLAIQEPFLYLADGRGGLVILGGDGEPMLSVNNGSIVEGDSGTAVLPFTITLSTTNSLTVTVDYETADVTATANSDYIPVTGTLTFAPGETEKTLEVVVNGDEAVEPDETFSLNLSNPVNATLLNAQAIGTIINDDTEIISYMVYLPVAIRP